MDNITLTKDQLKAALVKWEALARAGGTTTHAKAAAKPVEQVAAESTNYLWGVLCAQGAAK